MPPTEVCRDLAQVRSHPALPMSSGLVNPGGRYFGTQRNKRAKGLLPLLFPVKGNVQRIPRR